MMSRTATSFTTALFLLTVGCTAVSPRPKNTFRTLFHITPRASAIGADDFVAAMDRITSSTRTSNNNVRLLTNGDEAFPLMLEAIDKAEKRISLVSYIIRLDNIGRAFVKALTEAARRGVEVRLLIDAFGSRTVSKHRLKTLSDAGGMIRIFNPIDNWTLMRINNRNHQKILVIDGTTAFLGGLNLAKEYDGDGRTGWRDTHMSITGPAAYRAELVFAESWQQGGVGFLGKDLPVVGVNTVKKALDYPVMKILGKDDPWLPPLPTGKHYRHRSVSVRIVKSDPDQISSSILDMMLLVINSARKRVWVTSGYFVPPRILSRALCRASRRGVDVCLLLQGKTDEPTTRTLSIGFYGPLLKHKVKIYEWQQTVLHAKTIVADGRWTTIGSTNLDGRALFLDYEVNAAVEDILLAHQMEQQFQRDLKNSIPITLKQWKQRSWKQRATEVMLTPVQGQF